MRVVIRLFFRLVRLILTPFMLAYAALSKPKALTRSAAAQAEVDAACRQLTLYHFKTCPFCIKVRKHMHRLALPIALADAQHDDAARQALQAGGGRVKVPCLYIRNDDGSEQWMYESDDINRYLSSRFEP